ncbi:MAG: AmmeMemoRadiSam system protein A [Eubacteriaceae bacterium]|nr:AmmeMemoRadiSam system protein A [Eubacteriaceae bacterium]
MELKHAYIIPHPPLIIPQVGRGQEREIKKTVDSIDKIAKEIAEIKPDIIIVTSPHSIVYSDYFHISPGKYAEGSFSQFGASDVKIRTQYDEEFIKNLSNEAKHSGVYAGTLGQKDKSLDHATMIPLYFINKYYTDYKTVRIGISGQSLTEHYKLGKCIKQAAEKSGKNIVFIASGDMSHKLTHDGYYGFAQEGVDFDKQLNEAIVKSDFMKFLTFDEEFLSLAAECGLRSFVIMAGVYDKMKVKSHLLSYEGPFGVGYTVASFEADGEDESRNFYEQFINADLIRREQIKNNEDDYVRLARATLEAYINEGRIIDMPDNLPGEMLSNRAGVFVSLKKNKMLRGCIGTIMPTRENIASEIIHNAISAGVDDPRFEPLRKDELDELEYSVDVLGEAESISSKEELDVYKYGVIVSHKGRKGLLLPNLEGVDSVDYQISIALQKAGIRPNEPYEMQRFEVVRHK